MPVLATAVPQVLTLHTYREKQKKNYITHHPPPFFSSFPHTLACTHM